MPVSLLSAMGSRLGSWAFVLVFIVSVVLTLPALRSLSLISGEQARTVAELPPIDGHEQGDARVTWQGMKSLLLDRRLQIFAACVVLFFAAVQRCGPGSRGR